MAEDKKEVDILLDEEASESTATDKDKVDIVLDEELPEGELTPEQQTEADLATAERYLNIAEHMKQFEDQDKYYTRAIKYIRQARNYYRDVAKDPVKAEVYTDAIRKLARIKFTIRSEGKINLYNEACRVRDSAKNPSDFYNAQSIFERIHKYEIKHAINEKWVTPELYEQTKACEDSEEQARICRKLGDNKRKQIRRRSLVVSIGFIAVVAALLLFSRTLQFRKVLAQITGAIGDHEGSWHSYQYLLEHGDNSVFDSYIEARYQAGLDAEKRDDIAEAIGDFRAAAKEGDQVYKDSEDRLLKLELERLRHPEKYESGIGKVIPFGDTNWRILEIQDDKLFLLKDSAMHKDQITGDLLVFNDKQDDNLTWENSSLRVWLNDADGSESDPPGFLGAQFTPKEQERILETSISGAGNSEYNVPAGNATTDKIFLLTAEEVEKYCSMKPRRIATSQTNWWLRTPGKNGGSMAFVNPNRQVMYYGYDAATDFCTVKPCMWVDISE